MQRNPVRLDQISEREEDAIVLADVETTTIKNASHQNKDLSNHKRQKAKGKYSKKLAGRKK